MIDAPHYGVVDEDGAVWLETCFHEAGHAVAAKRLGVPVLSVVVMEGGRGFTTLGGGFAELEDAHEYAQMTRTQIRDSQVISAAGGVASEMALMGYAHQSTGDASRWRDHPSCNGDRSIYLEANAYPGAVSMATAWNAAHHLLATWWGDVEGLAYQLGEQHRITEV